MKNVQDYLKTLKNALKGSDRATIQDALSDAEEYLVNALAALRLEHSELSPEVAFQQVVEEYGSPQEVASAYLEADQRLSPNKSGSNQMNQKSIFARFFGIYADPIAWGSLLFALISFVTGIVFFTWSAVGVSLSVVFLIFIFGLFFLLFFLYSLRGIALVEGKFVEALLGTRMPRRPLFAPRNLNWKEQLKLLIKDKHTWLTLVYTVIKLPLGTFVFSLLLVLLCGSLGLIALPFLWFGVTAFFPGVVSLSDVIETQQFLGFWGQNYMFIIYGLVGILLLTVSMHIARGTGILQAKWAKLMLVVD